MMAESSEIRLVQLAGVGEALYGLDTYGQMWFYEPDRGWWPCAMAQLSRPPALGLTTVARTPDVR